MGRLDDIVDRNKHPSRHRKMRFPVGIMLSAFVLLILILMIFTDLGLSKSPTPSGPPAAGSDEKRVDGVILYRAPRDAGGRD